MNRVSIQNPDIQFSLVIPVLILYIQQTIFKSESFLWIFRPLKSSYKSGLPTLVIS
uniref:Uncharacterized protein n=1 Tax=Schistosoma japonicum TaxID=6182 RepID=Q5C2B2_SCHJA|nr:unknown [Schistosoma japonicum]